MRVMHIMLLEYVESWGSEVAGSGRPASVRRYLFRFPGAVHPTKSQKELPRQLRGQVARSRNGHPAFSQVGRRPITLAADQRERSSE